MNGMWPILIFAIVAVAAVVIGSIYESHRRKELAAFAGRSGLEFTPDAGGYADRYTDFTPFGQGSGRTASNLIYGRRRGVDWEMFDYRYTTGSGKRRTTHRYGIVVARVRLEFPRMTMRPEGVFDKIASLAGFDDINFESEEFSRRYHVKSQDRQRVYDLIHPKMMEYLLTLPSAHWQFGPGVVMLIRGGRYDAAELERAMGMIEGFLSRVPSYARDEMGHGRP
jgi:uncharacterized protein DUF3137